MTNTVTAITGAVNAEALWGIVGNVVPVVLIVTLFALGFYLIRRQMKKVSKGKGGM